MATGLILVLNFPRGGLLLRFADWSRTSGLLGRLVQIVVLPYCTWILLGTLGLIWYLERPAGRGKRPVASTEGWPNRLTRCVKAGRVPSIGTSLGPLR